MESNKQKEHRSTPPCRSTDPVGVTVNTDSGLMLCVAQRRPDVPQIALSPPQANISVPALTWWAVRPLLSEFVGMVVLVSLDAFKYGTFGPVDVSTTVESIALQPYVMNCL